LFAVLSKTLLKLKKTKNNVHLPDKEAGVFDLDPTDPGESSGREESLIGVVSPFTSSVTEGS